MKTILSMWVFVCLCALALCTYCSAHRVPIAHRVACCPQILWSSSFSCTHCLHLGFWILLLHLSQHNFTTTHLSFCLMWVDWLTATNSRNTLFPMYFYSCLHLSSLPICLIQPAILTLLFSVHTLKLEMKQQENFLLLITGGLADQNLW